MGFMIKEVSNMKLKNEVVLALIKKYEVIKALEAALVDLKDIGADGISDETLYKACIDIEDAVEVLKEDGGE
jgi:hypothetical protein